MDRSGRVLVAVDEPEALESLAALLSQEQYEICCATNVTEIFARIAKERPDLLLLDFRCNGTSSLDVCGRLKADLTTCDLPAILFTQAHERIQRVEGLRLGAVDFIIRPFQPEELLTRVRIHVDRAHRLAELERQVAEQTSELRKINEQLLLELSERHDTEQALIESERRFRELANHAPVAIWVTGTGDAATFCNRRALLFVGRRMGKVMAAGWSALVHPDDLQSVYSRYFPAVAARRRFRIECRLLRRNGQYRWVLNTGTPRFVNGAFCGYIGTSVDITDLKRAHERQLAAGKLESLRALTAGIAHDFNNLLSTIFVEADLAFAELPADSPVKENIHRIGGVAMRASEIVQLLMAYAGGGEVVTHPVNLSKTVSEMLKLLKSSLSKNATVKELLDFDMPAVYANAPQMRQVVLNLLTNAAEALRAGQGVITVATGCYYLDHSSAGDWGDELPPGDYGWLSVSDNGWGLSDEACTKVFDPYYTTKFLGRGLGLAVVQGIVRAHHGAVRVSSSTSGSVFEVLLPCARPESRTAAYCPVASPDEAVHSPACAAVEKL